MPESPNKILRVFRATVEHPSTAQLRTRQRAPRINLNGSISGILQLENGRKLGARLHRLSVTGGLLEVTTYLDERVKVDLTIPFSAVSVRMKAELLFPMRSGIGFLQPFRITRMSGEDLQLLDAEITKFRKQAESSTRPSSREGLRPPYLDSF